MTRLVFVSTSLLLPLAFVYADSVKLKSGEVVEGRIIQSDANGVVIETQFSPTITDQRHIARADIAATAVASPDEVAFAKIQDLGAPDTALDVTAYTDILDRQLRPFVRKYPYSPRAQDVKAKIAAFETDMARLKAGDVKVAGIWYDPASFTAEKYQIEAAANLAAMQREAGLKNYPAALNSFGLLQRTYPSSLAFAESLPLAEKTLEKLAQQLTFTIANLPQTKAQRQAAVERTPIEQRAPIQQAIAAEDARAAAFAEAAERNGQRFFAILPYDEKGLDSMQEAAQNLAVELKAIDRKKLAAGAKLARQANTELARHELPALETTLPQLQAAWPEYEGIARLQQRLMAEKNSLKESSRQEANFLDSKRNGSQP
ncbi:MAG: hypothetical protein PHC88_08970 [Terrimicrobiaceae bacterium]|nr:hypothetical protein [Terrimicrobiaceae bacterium]